MKEQIRTTILGILKLIPFAIVTALLVSLCVDEDIAFFVFLFFWWLAIPAIPICLVLFFMSLRCRNKWQLTIVIWNIINVLFLAILLFLPTKQNGGLDYMAQHYEQHHTEMEALHRYVKSALADNCEIRLEFKHNKPEIFHVRCNNDIYSCHWHEEARQLKDSLMTVVGLSQKEYDSILKRLNNMGCIGIDYSQYTSEQLTIWFRREGLALYSYIIFNRPMTDEEKTSAMKATNLIPYNDHCSFKFQGGAFGPDEFDKHTKTEFLKKHKPW